MPSVPFTNLLHEELADPEFARLYLKEMISDGDVNLIGDALSDIWEAMEKNSKAKKNDNHQIHAISEVIAKVITPSNHNNESVELLV